MSSSPIVEPTDELAAVDGEPVLSPDGASLAALIGGILSGPRPLTFTFAGGARRVAAYDAQERKRSSEGADDARARSCREACGRAEALLEECREWSRGGGGDAHLAAAAGSELARARSRKRRPRAREVAEEVSLEERRADSPTYARFQKGDLRNSEPLSYNSLMSLDDDEKDAAEEKRTDSLMSLDDSKSGRAPSPWSVYEPFVARGRRGRLTDASLEDMLEPEDADAPPPLPPAPLLVEEEEAELLRSR
ncbi:PGAP1-like protein [Aureococcus anophagefferens]|nr:PGAP1-like protein [Aureococcus anophagefferens]